ncbi:hypothetical protein L3X38_010776 [Prunus dulcis]|uniref:NAD(P)-linked oxidoreductase superfamily protein n=1 Tax=Prunus dulcis TaxID=3755 RepID=A0AAD4WG95_PRUDU|nr:hypothetical protein L3X38_010776 [Prunus dulcis]
MLGGVGPIRCATLNLDETFWELTGFGFVGTPKLSELEAGAIPGWVTTLGSCSVSSQEQNRAGWSWTCLKKLRLDYLDLYLVHFPVATKHTGVGTTSSALDEDGVLEMDTTISLETTRHAMEELVSFQ